MLDIVVEDPAWADADLVQLAIRAAQALSAHLRLPPCEATVMATDDAQIAQLNTEFRGKAAPTNVLSWPSEDRAPNAPLQADAWGDLHLGDVALAYQTITQEAQAQGKTLQAHTSHLIVHGVLHLLGYDHETDADATLMEGIEREVLGKLGLPDPY